MTPCSDTPETDEIWNGEWNHAYLFSRMRKMERERDELRSVVTKARDAARGIQEIRWGHDGDCGSRFMAECLEDMCNDAL